MYFIYKLSVLNVLSYMYILACLNYLIINWEILSTGEGWGAVGILSLIFIGFVMAFVDLVLQLLIKNKIILNGIGFLVALFVVLKLFIPQLH